MKVRPHTLQIQEVAKLLGVSLGPTYRAAREGTLPFPVLRIGNRFVVPLEPFEKITGISVNREAEAA